LLKRLLRRTGTIADPVAAGGPAVAKRQHPRSAAGERGVLEWTWVFVVALVNARSYRRAAARVGRGTHVVADRWLVDALVDLVVRYGQHRAAAWLLRRVTPQPDLSLFLEVDVDTAIRRKPGDQAPRVLEAMALLYAEEAVRNELITLDARLPLEVLAEQARALLDVALAPTVR
jgi:thymidylate kinase